MTRKVIFQQCPWGLDANETSYPHDPHLHHTAHGHPVMCRGWFPLMSTARGGLIDYFKTKSVSD